METVGEGKEGRRGKEGYGGGKEEREGAGGGEGICRVVIA